jgi:hypothetical protein
MSEHTTCDHEWFIRRQKVCECDTGRSRKTWEEKQVFYHETVIAPDTRVAEWIELVDTTEATDSTRKFECGRRFARLVIPVPIWLVDLIAKMLPVGA